MASAAMSESSEQAQYPPRTLLSLPTEVLEPIIKSVPSTDCLRSLRLTCKILQYLAEPELFNTVTVYPDLYSFRGVLSLSKDRQINRCVRTLEYEVRYFDVWNQLVSQLQILHSETASEIWNDEAVKFALSRFREALDPCGDREKEHLQEIVRNLPRLEGLTVRESGQERQNAFVLDRLPSYYRTRWYQIQRLCGGGKLTPHNYQVRSQTSSTELVLLAAHNAPRLQRLELEDCRFEQVSEIMDNPECWNLLKPSVAGLRSITIQPNSTYIASSQSLCNLGIFIRQASALKSLSLSFEAVPVDRSVPWDGTGGPLATSFLEDMGSIALKGGEVLCANLEELHFQGLVCRMPEFLTLLGSSKESLKKLSLTDFRLTPYEDAEDFSDLPCLVKTLEGIRKLSSLEYIDISGSFDNVPRQSWWFAKGKRLQNASSLGDRDMKSRLLSWILNRDAADMCPLEPLAVHTGGGGPIDCRELQYRANLGLTDESFRCRRRPRASL